MNGNRPPGNSQGALGLEETYRTYFLQYASYVITDRAIPDLADGLKPVQRRILHSLSENEDGRYNKVANLVGHCMKYHPHGDASIFAAMVGLAQKNLLIDRQGNWGDPATADAPAAARYIEARLTPLAREVLFAPQLTTYQASYDGRSREPVTLPVRFPLLLAMGAEGIAVGLTTRILPHNFVELLQAQKAWLRKEDFTLYPDFLTGGLVDVSGYRDGGPGSRIKVRARLAQGEGKQIIISQLAFGTSTESVVESILKASDKGKIKVASIQDNSAAEIEIVVTFQRGVDMDKAEAALYAFTQCQVSVAANGMVIKDGEPVSLTVSEMITENTRQLKNLLKRDLEYQLDRLQDQWHLKSLIQIFIEHRIYRRIEECQTWDAVLYEIDAGLEPHKEKLRREVTEEDLVALTEVKIRRISAWDANQARDELAAIDKEIAGIKRHLRSLTKFALSYIDGLLERYGASHRRRTEITAFDAVKAVQVVARNARLSFQPREGFIGTDLREGEELGPCSPLDDVLVILKDGGLLVTKVAERKYVGDPILHAQVLRPRDREQVFNVIYEDLEGSRTFVKRFSVGGFIRDRRYELGKGAKTRLLYLSVGNGQYAHVKLRKKARIKTDLYVRFDDLLVKGRSAAGNVLSSHKPSGAREISEQVYCNRLETAPDQLPPPAQSDLFGD